MCLPQFAYFEIVYSFLSLFDFFFFDTISLGMLSREIRKSFFFFFPRSCRTSNGVHTERFISIFATVSLTQRTVARLPFYHLPPTGKATRNPSFRNAAKKAADLIRLTSRSNYKDLPLTAGATTSRIKKKKNRKKKIPFGTRTPRSPYF